METLISMTDFIININEICPKENMEVIEWWGKKLDVIENYAKFLKQPLKLEMFVPCDEDGNVISKFYSEKENTKNLTFSQLSNQYQIAETKVLFENIPISQAKWLVNYFSTIEYLSDISNTITPIYLNNNAIKQIGL